MRRWLGRHRWLCSLVAAVLLFGQTVAVTAACAGPARPGHDVGAESPCSDHGASAGAVEHLSESTAEGDRVTHPLLCKAHCQAEQQSVNSGSATHDLPPVTALGALPWRLPDLAASPTIASPLSRAQAVGPPRGTPPLFLSLLVLRD